MISTVRVLGSAAMVAGALSGCASSNRHDPPQQAQLTRAVSAPDRLTPPAELPGPAREILRMRMASHAQDMGQLMSAIMVLQYDVAHERADAIANDANFARPLTGDATELNTLLPARFFDLPQGAGEWPWHRCDGGTSPSTFSNPANEGFGILDR